MVGMSSVRSICSVSDTFVRSTISFFCARAGYGSIGAIGVGLRSTKKSSLSLISAPADFSTCRCLHLGVVWRCGVIHD